MNNTKKCPFCAEEIQKEAIKCRFCGEFINSKCPYCAEIISISATKCNHCGELLKKDNLSETQVIKNDINKQRVNLSIGLIFAAIFVFLSSAVWLVISFAQVVTFFKQSEVLFGANALWNFFISIVFIAIGIGILKLKKWAYDWGLGSAILNTIWFGYNLSNCESDGQAFFLIFVIIIEVITIILLISDRNLFLVQNTIESKIKNTL